MSAINRSKATVGADAKKDEWPVKVFRFTSSKGWELYQPRKNEQEVTAAPKQGSVEIRKLRLRIRLFDRVASVNEPLHRAASHSGIPAVVPPSSSSKPSSTPHKESTKETFPINIISPPISSTKRGMKRKGLDTPCDNMAKTITPTKSPPPASSSKVVSNTTVVRRQDTILLSTTKGFGAIVLKFHNVEQCISFSDRLVQLNAETVSMLERAADADRSMQMNTYANKQRRLNSSKHSSMLMSGSTKCPVSERTQKEDEGIKKSPSFNGRKIATEIKVCATEQQQQQQQQQGPNSNMKENRRAVSDEKRSDHLSYMVRLLHDPGFKDFVDKMERSLLASPDCKHIMDALKETAKRY